MDLALVGLIAEGELAPSHHHRFFQVLDPHQLLENWVDVPEKG